MTETGNVGSLLYRTQPSAISPSALQSWELVWILQLCDDLNATSLPSPPVRCCQLGQRLFPCASVCLCYRACTQSVSQQWIVTFVVLFVLEAPCLFVCVQTRTFIFCSIRKWVEMTCECKHTNPSCHSKVRVSQSFTCTALVTVLNSQPSWLLHDIIDWPWVLHWHWAG